MKVLLKFHSTLTGGVEVQLCICSYKIKKHVSRLSISECVKNLKPFKQIMINITIYRSKPRLRIFLLKIPPYPHGLSGCVEIVI